MKVTNDMRIIEEVNENRYEHKIGILKVNSFNCETCESNKLKRNEKVCEVFNLPVVMYEGTTMLYGCSSYVKDSGKVSVLPEETKIKGRAYTLWDTQHSDSNALFAAQIIFGRVPKSTPEIIMLEQDDREPVFGVYVRKMMNGEKSGEV